MRSQWGRYNLPRDICCHINIAGFDMRNLWDFPAMGRWHRGGYREIFTCHRELKPKVLHQSYGIRQYGYIYIYIFMVYHHFPVSFSSDLSLFYSDLSQLHNNYTIWFTHKIVTYISQHGKSSLVWNSTSRPPVSTAPLAPAFATRTSSGQGHQ